MFNYNMSAVGTSVIIGVGRGIMLKSNKASLQEFGGTISLNKEWAKNILQQMGFTKRRANSILLENLLKLSNSTYN